MTCSRGICRKRREHDFPSQSFREQHALEELLVLIIRAALDHDWVQELCRLCFLRPLLCRAANAASAAMQRLAPATAMHAAVAHARLTFLHPSCHACMFASAFCRGKAAASGCKTLAKTNECSYASPSVRLDLADLLVAVAAALAPAALVLARSGRSCTAARGRVHRRR